MLGSVVTVCSQYDCIIGRLVTPDKTDGFLKHATEISRMNFAGGFLQAGVSELTMACVCIGIMLHGGMITAMGTFFVFSDYMKPAIRMAALMEVL